MPQDVRDLGRFYQTPLGQRTRQTILARLHHLWSDMRGRRLLGYGYALPYLSAYLQQAERVLAAMPARLGAAAWPGQRNLALLCAEDALPFPDLFFDRILVVHGLEHADALRALLRQLWRVLAPEGRALVVAPNRASLWAQVERSPFGYGRPFSRLELDVILKDALFIPGRWERALYAPPAGRLFTGSGAGWERIGARLFPGIGGIHLVEVTKSLYAAATPALPQEARGAAQLKAAGGDFRSS